MKTSTMKAVGRSFAWIIITIAHHEDDAGGYSDVGHGVPALEDVGPRQVHVRVVLHWAD